MKLLNIAKSLLSEDIEAKEIGYTQISPSFIPSSIEKLAYTENLNQLKQLKNINLDIPYKNKTFEYGKRSFVTVLYYDNTKMGLASLFTIDSNGINIDDIKADDNIRGQEIGIKFYQALAKAFNKPICSGQNQSQYSRYGIWEKLAKRYPKKITVIDLENNKEYPLSSIGLDNVYNHHEDHNYILKFNPL